MKGKVSVLPREESEEGEQEEVKESGVWRDEVVGIQ